MTKSQWVVEKEEKAPVSEWEVVSERALGGDELAALKFQEAKAAKEKADAATRTWGEFAGDTARSLTQGAIDATAGVGGFIHGLRTGDYDNTSSEFARGMNEVLQEGKSAKARLQSEAVQKAMAAADGGWEKAAVGGWETLKNPTMLADQVTRSLPGMYVGSIVGRGATAATQGVGNALLRAAPDVASKMATAGLKVGAVAPKVAGPVAEAVAALTQGSSVAGEAYEEAMKVPIEVYAQQEGFKELAAKVGAEEAKRVMASDATTRAGLMGSLASALSMRAIPGGNSIERMFVPKVAGEVAGEVAEAAGKSMLTKPLTKGFAGGIASKAGEVAVKGTAVGASEALSESAEEGLGAVAKALEVSRLTGEVPDLAAVAAEAAGQAAPVGFLMGKVTGMRSDAPEAPPPAPKVEDMPTTPQAPAPKAPTTSAQSILEREAALDGETNGTQAPKAEQTEAQGQEAPIIQSQIKTDNSAPAQPASDAGQGAGGSQPTQVLPVAPNVADLDPGQLLRVSQDPNHPMADAATVELKRREVEYLYQQREAQQQAQREADARPLIDEAVDQQVAQADAVVNASNLEAPTAMAAAFAQARPMKPKASGLAAELAAIKARASGATAPANTAPAAIENVAEPGQQEIADEFERLYQQDVKAVIQERLGLTPKATTNTAQAAKPVASPFRSFLREVGISSSLAADITGARGLAANNALPATFRKNGRNLDDLASLAVERGFLSQSDIDSAGDNGGTNKLVQMIQAEIRGERQQSADTASESAEQAHERVQRLEIEGAADSLGLQYSPDTSTDALATMVSRVQRRIDQANAPQGTTKAYRVQKMAIAAAQRIEQRRAAEAQRDSEYAALHIAEQNAYIDVIFDEDGTPIIVNKRAIDAELAAQQMAGKWSYQNEGQTTAARDQGTGQNPRETGPPVAGIQNQGAGDAGQERGQAQRDGEAGTEEGLSSYTPAQLQERESATKQAQAQSERQQRDIEQRAQADAELGEFTLTGSDRAADANPGQGGLKFSRSPSTKANYESRIDSLFKGEKATSGTKVLDRSDVMGLLGHPDVPLVLNESHLIDGLSTHPELTAQAWKKVPDWIENPAMVYSDPRDSGRLVVIAPQDIAGYPVMLVVEPKPTPSQRGKSSDFQLLVTVYAKTNGSIPSPGLLASTNRLLYIDKTNAPAVLQRAGVQFPGQAALQQGRAKILTEKNLAGWRKANAPKYSFAGRNAATANIGTLEQAQQRTQSGEDAEAVRQDTGWHKGVDGEWRFEISDKLAKIGTAFANKSQDTDSIENWLLPGVVWHDSLYAAYPELREYRVNWKRGEQSRGGIRTDEKAINVTAPTLKDTLSVLLHEIQHAIQEREGFASGGSPDTAAMDKVKEINESLSWVVKEKDSIKAMQYAPGADPKKIKDQLHELDVYYRQLLDDRANIDHFGTYKRLAGETEARNTQARMGMDDAQRRASAPSQTQDVADAEQIVRRGSGRSEFTPRNLNRDITLTIPIEGGGTAKMTVNAQSYIDQLDRRQQALEMVKECMV